MNYLCKASVQKVPEYFRCRFANTSSRYTIIHENLSYQRGLLRISGLDVKNFLQGLITNDIFHLKTMHSSMFTLFLNKQGRVLYDAIIYKNRDENAYLIECDRTIEKQLKQHLLLFRIRKQVNIDIVSNEMNIWACFEKHQNLNEIPKLLEANEYKKLSDEVIVCLDPRVNQMGLRLITPKSFNLKDFQKVNDEAISDISDINYNYKVHRYVFGICEGIREIPPSRIFPFEVNCDYLHGISFHKGCYLGQEFTARTYHTGTIRKRIMPIILDSSDDEYLKIQYDESIRNEKNQIIGKIKVFASFTNRPSDVRIRKI
ncbi:putative transferase CAF17 homolog, mitochondrial isoform X2 [Contarinia nasturtii]|uniref:putative transferase CAF17 homolog, mitochondrial isoform X2 n=1 Tax=Contarinia nasturtii TaxID=265458 RepID=UPI0012D43E9E|nr:putative transferase CAF17 homolog, mitochondrial isoform X2 [Contarinia nasturtii]